MKKIFTVIVMGATLLGVSWAAPAKKPATATSTHQMVAHHKTAAPKAPAKTVKPLKATQPKK